MLLHFERTILAARKMLLRGLVSEGYEVIPLTRLELEPYDLNERFEGLPNLYPNRLPTLGMHTRKLNIE